MKQQKILSDLGLSYRMEVINIHEIKFHDFQDRKLDTSSEQFMSLFTDIDKVGILEPPILSSDGFSMSGRHRITAQIMSDHAKGISERKINILRTNWSFEGKTKSECIIFLSRFNVRAKTTDMDYADTVEKIKQLISEGLTPKEINESGIAALGTISQVLNLPKGKIIDDLVEKKASKSALEGIRKVFGNKADLEGIEFTSETMEKLTSDKVNPEELEKALKEEKLRKDREKNQKRLGELTEINKDKIVVLPKLNIKRCNEKFDFYRSEKDKLGEAIEIDIVTKNLVELMEYLFEVSKEDLEVKRNQIESEILKLKGKLK